MSLDDIRARAEAAEPGPWYFKHCPPCTERGHLDAQIWGRGGNAMIAQWGEYDEFSQPDAEFIAHARTDIPKLLAALDAVQADLAEAAVTYRATADRLDQQVIERRPDRDPEAATRYGAYASLAKTFEVRISAIITEALQ